MNKNPIGILDSGVGGLSIWREIVAKLPHESTIYIADSANCPYGSKSSEEIYRLSKRLVEFLISKNCKLIVVACNTITVSCLERLRLDFPEIPIVGTVPVVKTAVRITKNKKIGILSTSATAKSSYQKNLIAQFANDCEIFNFGTDALVPYVERGDLNSRLLTQMLQAELKPFVDAGIDTLALGCSHFPFLKSAMQDILRPQVQILDSGEAIARQVVRVLTANKALSQNRSTHQFFTTGNNKEFESVAKKLLEREFGDVREVTFPFQVLTTIVWAILSCQPCFFLSQILQRNPRPRARPETI